jgi:hypothetical protein
MHSVPTNVLPLMQDVHFSKSEQVLQNLADEQTLHT